MYNFTHNKKMQIKTSKIPIVIYKIDSSMWYDIMSINSNK